mgnify:CR=1 FL=1
MTKRAEKGEWKKIDIKKIESNFKSKELLTSSDENYFKGLKQKNYENDVMTTKA